MLSFLPSPVKGLIAASLLIINTLVLCGPLFFFALLKFIIPIPSCRRLIGRIINGIAELWITFNSGWMKLTQKCDYRIEGIEKLDPRGWYLVTANHQSWADITIMQHILNRRVPFMKFFLKQELIWVPVIGLCWWALDFPFMKRYTKAYLEKYPEKKGKDLETTRNACQKFKDTPVSIVNYLEGTRFSEAKHKKQKSPFEHLLRPRAGGISYVISAMGEQIRQMVNITIYYGDRHIGYWDFLCGRIRQVTISIDVVDIPNTFFGKDYQNDEVFREQFQGWVNQLWIDKDEQLQSMANASEMERNIKKTCSIV
ncbi:acyltransferase [Endozoicomonas sp. Mp262]|uniref:acyltransferase n=1 Tax=Endozoicomonas sp. Mp262 TaxID=2919499 RepID=UPI0021D86D5E